VVAKTSTLDANERYYRNKVMRELDLANLDREFNLIGGKLFKDNGGL
jgi:hypothetical protein